MLVPKSLTEAIEMALASAEPADEPVLDLRSLINGGGVEGGILMGILTAWVMV